MSVMTLLTVADLHCRAEKYEALSEAVAKHKPDVLALLGDFLDVGSDYGRMLSSEECCRILSSLPVREVVGIRGNHEDANWMEFALAWPIESKRLCLIHGGAVGIGPMVLVGFPCLLGDETTFSATLPMYTGEAWPESDDDRRWTDLDSWLPMVIRPFGAAARGIWLMHEPPRGTPLSARIGPIAGQAEWREAIERYSPRLVLFGHDHLTPIQGSIWHHRIGQTLCVNVGQPDAPSLHYCVIDLEFPGDKPCPPRRITVTAYPARESVQVASAHR